MLRLCLLLGSHQWEQFTMHFGQRNQQQWANRQTTTTTATKMTTTTTTISTTPIILFPKCCCFCCFISGLVVFHEQMDLKQLVLCIERNTFCFGLRVFSVGSRCSQLFSLHKTFSKSILICVFEILASYTRIAFLVVAMKRFSHFSQHSHLNLCVCVQHSANSLALFLCFAFAPTSALAMLKLFGFNLSIHMHT